MATLARWPGRSETGTRGSGLGARNPNLGLHVLSMAAYARPTRREAGPPTPRLRRGRAVASAKAERRLECPVRPFIPQRRLPWPALPAPFRHRGGIRTTDPHYLRDR